MAKDFTKVYDENARLKAENTKLEAELKGKDELLFAYESVRAPINPLYAENAELKAELKTKDKEWRCPCGSRIEGMGYDQTNKLVIFQCTKCHAQIHIAQATWEQALKGESNGKNNT